MRRVLSPSVYVGLAVAASKVEAEDVVDLLPPRSDPVIVIRAPEYYDDYREVRVASWKMQRTHPTSWRKK